MDADKFQFHYVYYNRDEEDDEVEVEVPRIEPYLITEGPFEGLTVRDLVEMRLPGLRALISVMSRYDTHHYKCANSIVYELMLAAVDIFAECREEQYPELLCILCELYSIMPGRSNVFDMYFCSDDDEIVEEVTLYDLICRSDPDECQEYLEDIILKINSKPMFIYVAESEGYYDLDEEDGRCGVVPGMNVAIVRKENQGTDKYDVGVVDEVLTKSLTHPRGIKVKLKDGKIGRVQKIFC